MAELRQSADTFLSTGGEVSSSGAGQDKASLPCCPLEKQWPVKPPSWFALCALQGSAIYE